MKFKFSIKREIQITAALLVVVLFIAFTEIKQKNVAVRDVTIRIENIHNNHFLEESDIVSLMQLDPQNLRGSDVEKLNLREIERKIMKDPFIHKADMYSDVKGNLVVRVELRRPIARIVRNDGPDGYIAEDGTLMPVSDKFTARVVLLTGAYVRNLLQLNRLGENEDAKRILDLIMTIRENEFWNAQIAQLDIDGKGKITFYTQVGDEKIEFGSAENAEVKLKKLLIFYKEVLPRAGWNKYQRVNLEYEGQIVAE